MAKPGGSFGRAAVDGVAKRLLFVSAQGAELRGRRITPGGVGGEVALLGTQLMDAASHELTQAHERVGGEREREGVVGGDREDGAPVFKHEGAGLPLKSAVGSCHGGVVRERGEVGQEELVNHRGKGEAFEEGEGEVGQGVDREVGPDRRGGARRSPVERHNIRGQAGTQRPVGVQGPGSEEGGVGPAEAGRCRIDGGRGTDEAKGRHASLMREEDVERGET